VFIEAKDNGGGGDNWTTVATKSCKAPVKSSPPTNQHPIFFTGRMKHYTKPKKSKTLFGLGFVKTIPSPRLGFLR